MKTTPAMTALTVAVALFSPITRAADEPGHVALSPVPIQAVHIDDPFWSPKYDVWRRITFADCFDKFEHDGTLENFDHVARGEVTAKHGGAPWFDGLLYEMIRAGADFMAEQPDLALKARLALAPSPTTRSSPPTTSCPTTATAGDRTEDEQQTDGLSRRNFPRVAVG